MRHSPSKALNHKSAGVLELLQRYESRNITFIEPDGSWPIVWERARDVWVWDAEGKKYLDLTAAFGVAAAGHANPRVVRAGQRQMSRLLHAMGDVHPHALKAQLARELSRLTFERWTSLREVARSRKTPNSKPRFTSLPRRLKPATGKTVFCNSGFEAVEAALKTAMLATGRPGVIAFEGAYHGLGYGALNATHREHFRSPFRLQLREFGFRVPFPRATLGDLEERLESVFSREQIGAVLVEPIQVRGGVNVPPPEFLPLLRQVCDRHQALLILDEIYTGFGRTGRWFACEHSHTVPDLICLGKALTGGFPLSACVGSAEVMDRAWPRSAGEAIHTSTFLGHPVGCAMALAQIKEIEARHLVQRSAELGEWLLQTLARSFQMPRGTDCRRRRKESFPRTTRPSGTPHVVPYNSSDIAVQVQVRGLGLLAGVELRDADGKPATTLALDVIKNLLHAGFVLLPEGEFSNVISFTPPLTIPTAQLSRAVNALAQSLERVGTVQGQPDEAV